MNQSRRSLIVLAFVIHCLSISIGSFFLAPVQAGGPENLLLVVNAESADSLAIANHYIHLRGIPANNVLYLNGIPQDRQVWDLKSFRTSILHPVVDAIENRKLGQQIDYVIYSAGFPTAIDISSHGERLSTMIKGYNRRAFNPRASINSLTYFYTDVIADNPTYMTLESNWYVRRLVRGFLKTPFIGETQQAFTDAIARYDGGDLEKAAQQLTGLVRKNPGQVAARYCLVRTLAADGKVDEAILQLANCVRAGWCYRNFTENDTALAALRKDPRFADLIEGMPNLLLGQLPTRGFSNQVLWARNGWANSQISQGKRFVLSTVLAVTSGRGTTLQQALDHITRSVAADATNPKGTFYFASTRDVRSTTRKPQFRQAISLLKKLGFKATETRTNEPLDQDDVLGATLGFANIDWEGSRSKFIPGAICDNLTSYGGNMTASANQTPLTDYIANGAAGASGAVIEPLAIDKKFPSAMLHVHYARGCTLAESFYQSVAGPFQLLIVGDPLCKPWARLPEFTFTGIENDQTVDKDFQLNLQIADGSPAISRFELFLDGRRGAMIRPGQPARISIAGMSDGYHELRIVAVTDTLIGSKSSQRVGFIIKKNDLSAVLTLNESADAVYHIDRTILVKAESSGGERIDIFQNSRKLGAIEGQAGELRFDCSQLGLGHTTLRAISTVDGKTISSPPVYLEITN